jgi:ABC-2 type transport system permease protein
MTVFRNYFKRILGRPTMVLFTLAVPVLIVLILTSGGTGNAMRVAFIDNDRSFLSEMVREAVEPVARFVELDYEDIGTALVEGRIEYALVIPRGMEEHVISGEKAKLEAFSLQGVEMTRTVRAAAEAVLSSAHNVALYARGDRGRFLSAMEQVEEGAFSLHTESFRQEQGALTSEAAAGVSQLIGMLTLTMLLMTMGSCLLFLKDVDEKTFHRTLAGPVSQVRYMFETNLAFFCGASLQALAAAFALGIAVPQLSSSVLFLVAAILVTFSLFSVSFTLAVANTMKTVKRTLVAANFLVIPMVMLGGAFWPFDIMPRYLQKIGTFSPARWAIKATESVLSGGKIGEIIPALGVILLFALVFQLLGSWRRLDLAKQGY